MLIDTISDESTGKVAETVAETVSETIADTVGNQVSGGGLTGRQKRQAGQGGQPNGPLNGPPDGVGGGLDPGGNFQNDQGRQGEPDPPPVNEDFSRDADFLQLYMELTPDVRHRIGHRLTQAWTS